MNKRLPGPIIPLSWPCLVWKRVSLWMGAVNNHVLSHFRRCDEQTNDQTGDPSACLLLTSVRRQSFVIQRIQFSCMHPSLRWHFLFKFQNKKINPRTCNENATIIANVVQYNKTPEEQGSGPRGGNLAESLLSSFLTELAQVVHAGRDMNQINSAWRTLLLIAKVFFW